MTKMVGAAEFKAKCLALLDEVQATGEPITVTKRGKPVVTVIAVNEEKARQAPIFGALKSPAYRFDDPFSPVFDMDAWEANNPPELYGKG